MHCPRCGQQQVSEELKFCSRCGLPLGLVSEIIVHGGFLPQLADLSQDKTWLTRKNGVVFSVFWFIFWVPLLTSFFGGVLGVEVMGALCALIGIFGGLMLFIGSLVFLKKTPKHQHISQLNDAAQAYNSNLPAGSNRTALPPPSYQPVDSYMPPAGSWKAPNTDDLVQPGSVTDATTKLLKKEE